jgi:predicted porin
MKTLLRVCAFSIALTGAAQAQSSIAIYGVFDAGLPRRSGAALAIGEHSAGMRAFKGAQELGPGLKLELRYAPDIALRGNAPAPSNPFSISASGQERGRAFAANDSTSAWMVGTNVTLAAGTVQLGYGRNEPDHAASARQLSIGYAYPLSKQSFVYADAFDSRAAKPARHINIGISAAF